MYLRRHIQFLIFFVIFYQTFSVTSGQQHKFKVFKNIINGKEYRIELPGAWQLSKSARNKLENFLHQARASFLRSPTYLYQRGQMQLGTFKQLVDQLFESVVSSMSPTFQVFGKHLLSMITDETPTTVGQDQFILDNFPDVQLSTIEMIERHGYPAETHNVTTDDGYILELHRIPREGAPVVFLQHGLFCSSSLFVLLGPQHSLAYLLWDAGFDVWMGNARGNTYSRRHISLDTEDEPFWNFSWHEMGTLDLPAVLSHILQVSNQPDIYYVGHSMGNTMMLVLTSLKPEFNDKLKQVHAISPFVFPIENKKPFMFYTKDQHKQIFQTLKDLRITEIYSKNSPILKNVARFCSMTPFNDFFCSYLYSTLFGGEVDSSLLNVTMTPYFLSVSPGGSSLKTAEHFLQLINTGKFSQFDYGRVKNLELYKNVTPPEYHLKKVTVPIQLYLCKGDAISRKNDLEILNSKLPNSLGIIEIEDFNHVDPFWSTQAKERINDLIIKAITDAEGKTN